MTGDIERGKVLWESGESSFWTTIGKLQFAPALEGLRGFAVVLVLASHVLPQKEMIGSFGVNIFFVLSGFLITGVLEGLKTKQTEATSKRGILGRNSYLLRFYIDRFVRLTPALLCMVVLMSVACLRRGIQKSDLYPDATAALTYTHNMFPTDPNEPRLTRPGMFHNTWSLATEEQFYIVYSVIFTFLHNCNTKSRAYAFFALTILSFSVRYYAGYAFLSDHMYGIDYRFSWSSNVWKMYLGCAVRLLPIPRFFLNKAVTLLSTVFLAFLLYLHGWVLPSFRYDFRTEGVWLELFTALVTLVVICGSTSGNWLLEGPFIRFLGRVSYSVYLWQFPVLAYYGWPVGDWAPTCLAFCIATMMTLMVEEPIRNAYRKLSHRSDKAHEKI